MPRKSFGWFASYEARSWPNSSDESGAGGGVSERAAALPGSLAAAGRSPGAGVDAEGDGARSWGSAYQIRAALAASRAASPRTRTGRRRRFRRRLGFG